MKALSLFDVLTQDFWVHFAGLIVIGIGVGDLWAFHALSHDTELLLIIGGVAGMGLRIVNGSTAALRTAALDAAFMSSRSTRLAADLVAGWTSGPTTSTVTVSPAPPPAPPTQS